MVAESHWNSTQIPLYGRLIWEKVLSYLSTILFCKLIAFSLRVYPDNFTNIFCRSAASFLSAKEPCNLISNYNFGDETQLPSPTTSSNADGKQALLRDFQFPFGDWFSHPWLKQPNQQSTVNPRFSPFSSSSQFSFFLWFSSCHFYVQKCELYKERQREIIAFPSQDHHGGCLDGRAREDEQSHFEKDHGWSNKRTGTGWTRDESI